MNTSTMTDGTTKTYYSCAETAQFLRKALAGFFPGVKFAVRSKTYSGGASIRVIWTDGPTDAAVKRVCRAFEGADFDGMQDLKSYRAVEFRGRRVHFGADFIFTERALSPEAAPLVVARAAYLTGMSVEAWGQRPERFGQAANEFDFSGRKPIFRPGGWA